MMISGNDFKNLIQIVPGQGTVTLADLAARIANLLVLVAGILAFLYLVYAGILFITAGNNPDQAKKAQQAFVNVIIGVVVISISYLIVRFAGSFAVTIFK